MRRPALRRTRKFIRNVRAVWQFLKPQVHIYARKPRFTRLGFQWTQVDKAGTVRRTHTKEDLRRWKLMRKFLNYYRIQYRPYVRDTEHVKHDRYRLKGWGLRKQQIAPKARPVEHALRGPFLTSIRGDKQERAHWKAHPHRESAVNPERISDLNLRAAYEVDIWDCIDVEFHSSSCGCPECLPDVAVGEFSGLKTRAPRKRTRKTT